MKIKEILNRKNSFPERGSIQVDKIELKNSKERNSEQVQKSQFSQILSYLDDKKVVNPKKSVDDSELKHSKKKSSDTLKFRQSLSIINSTKKIQNSELNKS